MPQTVWLVTPSPTCVLGTLWYLFKSSLKSKKIETLSNIPIITFFYIMPVSTPHCYHLIVSALRIGMTVLFGWLHISPVITQWFHVLAMLFTTILHTAIVPLVIFLRLDNNTQSYID